MEDLKILDGEVGCDASFRCGVHDLKFNCLFYSWLWMLHIVSRSSTMLADAAGKHTLYRRCLMVTIADHNPAKVIFGKSRRFS